MRTRLMLAALGLVVIALLIAPVAAAPGGQTLVIATGLTTPTLNPHAAGGTPSVAVFLQMFEGLTRFNDKAKLEPALAVSWRRMTQLTWEFKLREGVQFHSGHPFNANDVKFSIGQIFRPELKSLQRNRIALVKSVDVVDDRTVRFVTEKPFPNLPQQLAVIFIASEGYYRERGEEYVADHPSGTGPFQLASWRPGGERIEFTAFDRYWDNRPVIGRLIFRQIPEGGTRVAALLAGEAHIASNVPIDLADVVNRTRGYRTVSGFLGNGLIIAFNRFKEGPQQNPKVREALTYAIDREGILRNLLKGNGRLLDSQVLTREAFGYNPNLEPTPYDPARARRLLSEAGFPNGFATTLATPVGRYLMDREIATAVAAQLKEVGIQATVQPMDLATLLRGIIDGSFPMWLVGYQTTPNFDADTALQWFHSGGVYKWTGDELTDRLILQARTTVDPEKRRALYWQITKHMQVTLHPAIFLFQTKALYGVSSQVDGFLARPDEFHNLRSVQVR